MVNEALLKRVFYKDDNQRSILGNWKVSNLKLRSRKYVYYVSVSSANRRIGVWISNNIGTWLLVSCHHWIHCSVVKPPIGGVQSGIFVAEEVTIFGLVFFNFLPLKHLVLALLSQRSLYKALSDRGSLREKQNKTPKNPQLISFYLVIYLSLSGKVLALVLRWKVWAPGLLMARSCCVGLAPLETVPWVS